MKLNIHIDWKKALVFLIVCGGLVFITHSVWLAAGILLILFVIDGLLANYEQEQKLKREEHSATSSDRNKGLL